MDNEKTERLATIPQLSRRLGLSTRTIRRAIASGALPACRPAGHWWRVRPEDASAWIRGRRPEPEALPIESPASVVLRIEAGRITGFRIQADDAGAEAAARALLERIARRVPCCRHLRSS